MFKGTHTSGRSKLIVQTLHCNGITLQRNPTHNFQNLFSLCMKCKNGSFYVVIK